MGSGNLFQKIERECQWEFIEYTYEQVARKYNVPVASVRYHYETKFLGKKRIRKKKQSAPIAEVSPSVYMPPTEQWDLLEEKIQEALKWVEQMRGEQTEIANQLEAERTAMIEKLQTLITCWPKCNIKKQLPLERDKHIILQKYFMTTKKVNLKTVDFNALTEDEIYWAVVYAYSKFCKEQGYLYMQPSQISSEVLKTRVVLRNSLGKVATFDMRKRQIIFPEKRD